MGYCVSWYSIPFSVFCNTSQDSEGAFVDKLEYRVVNSLLLFPEKVLQPIEFFIHTFLVRFIVHFRPWCLYFYLAFKFLLLYGTCGMWKSTFAMSVDKQNIANTVNAVQKHKLKWFHGWNHDVVTVLCINMFYTASFLLIFWLDNSCLIDLHIPVG